MAKRDEKKPKGKRGSAPASDAGASNPHDGLVLRLIGPKADAASYLASAIPSSLARQVDWSTLELRNGNYVDPELRRTSTDLLYSVKIQGRDGFIYLLLEHQSTNDPLMAFRILAYVVRIWEDWIRSQDQRPKMLPPVMPLVLYHGTSKWTAPTDVFDLIDLDDEQSESMGAYLPHIKFLIDDLTTQDDEVILDRALRLGPMAALLALKNVREALDLATALRGLGTLLADLVESEGARMALKALLRYIVSVRGEESREIIAALLPGGAANKLPEDPVGFSEQFIEEAIDQLYAKGRKDGREEGREEGRLGSLRSTLLKLLRLKFREVPDAAAARVEAGSEQDLEQWTERVLFAESVNEVLGE